MIIQSMRVFFIILIFVTSFMNASADPGYRLIRKSGSVRLESKINIARDCQKVWDVFNDANSWKEWNKDLYLRKSVNGIQIGTPLYLTAYHRLWYNPIKKFPVNVEVTELRPFELLVWKGKPMGVPGFHGFKLDEGSEGCRVFQWEEGFGPLAEAGRRMGVFDSMGQIHANFLKGLKTESELR